MIPPKPFCLLLPRVFPTLDAEEAIPFHLSRQSLFGQACQKTYQTSRSLGDEDLWIRDEYHPIIGFALSGRRRAADWDWAGTNIKIINEAPALAGPFLSLPETLFLFQDPFETLIDTNSFDRFRHPTFEILDLIHMFCDKNHISSSRVILGVSEGGGPKGINKKPHDLYYEEHASLDPIRFLYHPNLEACTARYYSEDTKPELASTLSRRKKKFTYLNKEARPQRINLCMSLWNRRILDNDFYWSFLRSREAVMHHGRHMPQIEEKGRGFLKVLPKTLDVDYLGEDGQKISLHPGAPAQSHLFFNDSYLSLISETTNGHQEKQDQDQAEEGQHTFLTEKTFKCFYFKHPFVVWTYPGTLQAIKDLGYQTFSPWINEEYDEIEGYEDRMEAVINEVVRLKALTHEQLHEMRTEMCHVLEYNFEHFKLSNVQIRNQINFRKQLGL